MKRKLLICLIVLALAVAVTTPYAEDNVKIAVASEGNTQAASVSNRAARCQYYLVFDGQGKLKVIDNPYKDAPGGAGPSAVAFLAEKGVTIVIAETFGHKMTNAMKDEGLAYYEYKGIASEAIKKVLSDSR